MVPSPLGLVLSFDNSREPMLHHGSQEGHRENRDIDVSHQMQDLRDEYGLLVDQNVQLKEEIVALRIENNAIKYGGFFL